MALFCELARDAFVAEQALADHDGDADLAREAGRNEPKRQLP
jgi:hypothetical protein